jgi:predicted amidophosphoribosyltransferase
MTEFKYFVFKRRCAKCNTLFIPDYCKACKYKDYGLCWQCHKKTEHHKIGVRYNV